MKNKKSIIRVSIIIAIIAFLFVLPVTVFSQDTLEEGVEAFGEKMDQWGNKMDAWGEDLEQSIENGEPIPPIPALPFGTQYDNDYELMVVTLIRQESVAEI
jgi:hypothetical protein